MQVSRGFSGDDGLGAGAEQSGKGKGEPCGGMDAVKPEAEADPFPGQPAGWAAGQVLRDLGRRERSGLFLGQAGQGWG